MLRKSKRRTESRLEAWCVRRARVAGVLVSKLTDPTGAPDRVFWVAGGRPLLVEFKDPGGESTPLQRHYQEELARRGYKTAVVRARETFLRLMTDVGVEI